LTVPPPCSRPAQGLRFWYAVLAGAAALHAVFHLWRHTTLADGALRRMTPEVLHKYL